MTGRRRCEYTLTLSPCEASPSRRTPHSFIARESMSLHFRNYQGIFSVCLLSVEEGNLGPWTSGLLKLVEAPGPANGRSVGTLVLVAKRTNGPNILNGFKHYEAVGRTSVGFTGSGRFILALCGLFLLAWFSWYNIVVDGR
ncbi:hypothetical protein NE237_024361 [Protea cynaroides]|uniref:Uncharacterized protein n=1 Tax=Protea cynaroides TaxID=273540 RepID=A0A9Q0HHV7_9MAGN|nr:hypothetical protein NE237_024361 [Protea cynaroides]